MGLTSALLLQRAGAAVTIYARDLPPNVRSSLATGIWSPDSRICLEQHATPAFRRQWEAMARESYQTYQTLLGLPGNPVEFIDLYGVSDAGARARAARRAPDSRPAFAELERELVPDLRTRPTAFAAGTHSLGAHDLERASLMMFNIAGYARMLMADFLAAGGRIRIAEFNEVADLAAIPQATLINATGYGARALFADPSIVPVRGQVARMIPQPDIGYGLFYRDVAFIPRRDGLVFQVVGDSDYYGYGDDSTTPDRAEAEHAVTTIAALYS
jgi:glycine/D-amino acid oxidase-like deaminating enzyme